MWEHLTRLRQILVERFNESELRTLCFDLGVDYESLPDGGKADKARELVTHLERRDRIRALVETGRQMRPEIPWEEALKEWSQARLDTDMERLRAKRNQADKARREMRKRQRVVNLRPLDVTHTFKDRLREMQALCDHLSDNSVRLVSVVGRSGIGKTALVSRVLADLEQGILPVPGEDKALLLDGILYLSACSTGLGLERIYTDVGRMLGEPKASKLAACWANRETPLASKIEYLLDAMRDGLYLILLDKLEDYLAEDSDIAEEGLRLFIERCLTQPSGVRLVTTSQEQVHLASAALLRARSIPIHEGLPEDKAVALLRELDPQGMLGLHDAPEAELRQAARLTQGIPRALEILAGILHEDPTASLPRLLADEILFGKQVVERLVAEGYRRLGEDERWVMEALAVFNRPVEETAITYLLHPWFPGLNVRASLRYLVNGYFVSASRVTGEYNLHPLDQEYAYQQIPETERGKGYTRRNLELRAADFYTRIGKPESEWRSIDDLAPQLAAFEHRVRAGDYDGACQILEPIDFNYLHLWGQYAQLAESREKLLGRLTDHGLQATNLVRLGSTYRNLGKIEQAIELYKQALAIAREISDRRNEGLCLGRLGLAYLDLGQFEKAIELYKQALANAIKLGDRHKEWDWHGHLGRAYHALGQVERAIKVYEEALTIAHQIDAPRFKIVRLNNLGNAYCTLGQFKKAIGFYEQALAVAREIGYRWGESYQLLGLGRALLAYGELVKARQSCLETLSLEISKISYQAALVLGIILLHQRHPDAGDTFADAAARSQVMLTRTADLYKARYVLAPALLGCAVCDPRWGEASERTQLLAPAMSKYEQALNTCAAPGVARDALWDLEMIRAAGVEGLEPVFALLQSATPQLSGEM